VQKCQNFDIISHFESSKHLHIKALLKPLNAFNKQSFETAYLGENVRNMLNKKVA